MNRLEDWPWGMFDHFFGSDVSTCLNKISCLKIWGKSWPSSLRLHMWQGLKRSLFNKMLTLRRSRRLEPGCPWIHQACSCRVSGEWTQLGWMNSAESPHDRLNGSHIHCPLLLWISKDCGGTAHIHQLANQGRIILAYGRRRKLFTSVHEVSLWSPRTATDLYVRTKLQLFAALRRCFSTHALQNCRKPYPVTL